MSSPGAPAFDLDALVRGALLEDIGAGDVTSRAIVPPTARARARIIARGSGIVAGTGAASRAFCLLDPAAGVRVEHADGERILSGETVLTVTATARAVLGAERVALNFLQHLSGIATLTRRFVDAVAGTGVVIRDTRKTLPGLRALEKDAVRAGGGANHRCGLFDMVLVKENHLRVAGSVAEAVRRARAAAPDLVVEVEAATRAEALEAVLARADRVLLDNLVPPALAEAVRAVRASAAGSGLPCPVLEASGGVTIETVRSVAESGVDEISVGALTHSAPILDMSLLVEDVG